MTNNTLFSTYVRNQIFFYQQETIVLKKLISFYQNVYIFICHKQLPKIKNTIFTILLLYDFKI